MFARHATIMIMTLIMVCLSCSVRTAYANCQSVQARCAIKVGGTCDPATGRWHYRGPHSMGAAFSDCVWQGTYSGHKANIAKAKAR